MLQRVIGTASIVMTLTLAGAGGAAGEPSQTPGLQPALRQSVPQAAAGNPCAAVNPCAARNPTAAKNRAVRSPAWVDEAGPVPAQVDRFSGKSVSDR
jgi:hypothetical protein